MTSIGQICGGIITLTECSGGLTMPPNDLKAAAEEMVRQTDWMSNYWLATSTVEKARKIAAAYLVLLTFVEMEKQERPTLGDEECIQ